MNKARIGIDLGGTKTEIIVLDTLGQELFRQRVATTDSYPAVLHSIAALIAVAEQETATQATIGIGVPGSINRHSNTMRNANSTYLNGQPFHSDLQALLKRPIRIANDANCMALSEAVDGAAAGSCNSFCAILGTGVGGGLALASRILVGHNGIGGEWGHIPLPAPQPSELPGADCFCGRRGCLETWLSGPALSRDYRAAGGETLSAEQIVSRADNGETLAERALERYEDRLARACSIIINIFDPAVIVLAGGMSKTRRLYQNVPKIWQQHLFSEHCQTALRPSKHGDSSGIRGAAWLWNDDIAKHWLAQP